ncbi:SRPBCC domain-containing protein [Tunturibacter psychrotolerans]|uniref:SRPBCC domain-containing protein n=1 Tax=Tunturiibacter psychrotolerans TaxID=3069686 RepID=A0AAU7ZQW5_9BACT
MSQVIEYSTTIKAPSSEVWRVLTDPNLMKQWIAEQEMRVRIITDWKVGSPIIVDGHHNNVNFENKGTVLHFEPNSLLRYSHFSSLSRLPDKAENYTIIEFRLAGTKENSTSLNVTISNFPSESILKHFEYYWRITIEVIKRFIESSRQTTTLQV